MIFVFLLEPREPSKGNRVASKQNRAKTGKIGPRALAQPSPRWRGESNPVPWNEPRVHQLGRLRARCSPRLCRSSHAPICVARFENVFSVSSRASFFRLYLRLHTSQVCMFSTLVPRCLPANHSREHREGLSLFIASLPLPTLIRIILRSSRPSHASPSSFAPPSTSNNITKNLATPHPPHVFLNMTKKKSARARDPRDPVKSS